MCVLNDFYNQNNFISEKIDKPLILIIEIYDLKHWSIIFVVIVLYN